jgi:hypothetical protein
LISSDRTSQSRSSLLRRAFSFHATLTRPIAAGGSGLSRRLPEPSRLLQIEVEPAVSGPLLTL